MIKPLRRTVVAGLAAWPLAAARGQTADFPDRPLRFVVGFPPGGPNDLLARLIAPGIAERLGRAVVVENRAGANGEIAAASVAKAPADGSAFTLASNGSTTIAAARWAAPCPTTCAPTSSRWRRSASTRCCWSCATACPPTTSPSCWRSRALSLAS